MLLVAMPVARAYHSDDAGGRLQNYVDDVDADQFTINGHETVFPDREKTLATFGDAESYSDHDHH